MGFGKTVYKEITGEAALKRKEKHMRAAMKIDMERNAYVQQSAMNTAYTAQAIKNTQVGMPMGMPMAPMTVTTPVMATTMTPMPCMGAPGMMGPCPPPMGMGMGMGMQPMGMGMPMPMPPMGMQPMGMAPMYPGAYPGAYPAYGAYY
eukprot:TRINITY_DN75_c0_g1_i1.p1 TRINITY_DN75_c0_g1~~TRINITY_DN75_c0_g1_i1.p1  ORF type:complete len:159 (+),score=41.64 TRINITY_DN75_c0_g1_i1:39-479(+)